MSIKYEDLFLAILSMDVYNSRIATDQNPKFYGDVTENYIHNLKNIPSTGNIGDAVRSTAWIHTGYGFFAKVYDWGGKTVIVFRGTDQGFINSQDSSHGFGVRGCGTVK